MLLSKYPYTITAQLSLHQDSSHFTDGLCTVRCSQMHTAIAVSSAIRHSTPPLPLWVMYINRNNLLPNFEDNCLPNLALFESVNNVVNHLRARSVANEYLIWYLDIEKVGSPVKSDKMKWRLFFKKSWKLIAKSNEMKNNNKKTWYEEILLAYTKIARQWPRCATSTKTSRIFITRCAQCIWSIGIGCTASRRTAKASWRCPSFSRNCCSNTSRNFGWNASTAISSRKFFILKQTKNGSNVIILRIPVDTVRLLAWKSPSLGWFKRSADISFLQNCCSFTT